jgi:sterol desaturase/sphingolipid hydroxylase (fatty acid hydroxylase superfamily)
VTANAPHKSVARARRLQPVTEFLTRLSLTRLNARLGLAFDMGVALVLLGAGVRTSTLGVLGAGVVVAIGLFLFSLVEYGLHRWLFHGKPNSMRDGHDQHHVDPRGFGALPFFLPPLGMLALARLLALVVPVGAALLLSGALAAGYAAYGLAHMVIHAVRFRMPTARRWAANHHIHHYHPDSNFGVTTPLWDILFATHRSPAQRRQALEVRTPGKHTLT